MAGHAVSTPAGSGTADSMLVHSCSEIAAGDAGLLTSPPFFVASSSLLWGSGYKNSCSETAAGESGLLTSPPVFVAGSSPFWGSGHRPPCGGGAGSRDSSCCSAPGAAPIHAAEGSTARTSPAATAEGASAARSRGAGAASASTTATAEDEYLLVPPPPGAEEQGLPLLPVPPPEGVRWPEPQKGELPATKKGEEVWRPLSPAAVSLQEFLWPEPHRRELPAMKKVGEVQRPAPTAAVSLLEGLWPAAAILLPEIVGEVRRPAPTAAVSLPEIVGEVRRPAPTAALSLQEVLWPQPHHGELPATKKGEVGGPPAPAAFSLQVGTSMLSAVPLPAGVLTAWPAMGPVKPPLPARDFVLDCWVFKGGGGH
ncbi:UNVERIFIED_CONTAM: hypothetical protein FKN15_030571 [Acipenser sinensis]